MKIFVDISGAAKEEGSLDLATMPGHVKRGGTGEPDPDPTPFLFISYEQKQQDLKRVRKQGLALGLAQITNI